jgi:hypothetical protein
MIAFQGGANQRRDEDEAATIAIEVETEAKIEMAPDPEHQQVLQEGQNEADEIVDLRDDVYARMI